MKVTIQGTYEPLSNNVLVPVILTVGERKKVGMFLVDTGSDRTIIDADVANRLGIPYGPPSVSLLTANGVATAGVAAVDCLELGPIKKAGMEVLVGEITDDILLMGLLGMDFFRGLGMTITPGRQLIIATSEMSVELGNADTQQGPPQPIEG